MEKQFSLIRFGPRKWGVAMTTQQQRGVWRAGDTPVMAGEIIYYGREHECEAYIHNRLHTGCTCWKGG